MDGGLTSAEAARRLDRYGPNRLPEQRGPGLLRRVLHQFRSPLIYILVGALAVDLVAWMIEGAHDLPLESIAIALVLGLNAVLGLVQEGRAERALAALARLAAPMVQVLRDGRLQPLDAALLVPGDRVRVEAGDRVPADGRLTGDEGLSLDESMLTGESVPVERGADDECSAGTLVVRGSAWMDVTATGPRSALGRIAELMGDMAAGKTPLERRLHDFGNRITRWIIVLTITLLVLGTAVAGPDQFLRMFLLATALAVAAIPEGLPAVLTLTLALGVERMARRKAVVRRLAAVEALGSVTVIATDKTGTLTENSMTVRAVESPDEPAALITLALANEADPEQGGRDPMERALQRWATAHGADPAELLRSRELLKIRPFDAATRSVAVTLREGDAIRTLLKGAPEELLERCALSESERVGWLERVGARGAEGFRVLGLASCDGEERDAGLSWQGLVMLWDPPRPEVAAAVRSARAAGIRVLMMTGDHPDTAAAIAESVGIDSSTVVSGDDAERSFDDDVAVFARVRPEHKLRLVEALQRRGAICAVTGDGINDALALKRSDVGVAMGQRGTETAREASDLVLLDDNFATIVAAIEEGRSIYDNIRKFVRFLFATNLAEVITVTVGTLLVLITTGAVDEGSLPLNVVQILWINLVTDTLPALAMAMDRNPGVLERPPRDPAEPLLDRRQIRFIVLSASLLSAASLSAWLLGPQLGLDAAQSRTALFLVLVIGQLLLTYPSRGLEGPSPFNPRLHAAVAGGIAMQILLLYLPIARDAMGLSRADLALLPVTAAHLAVVWLLGTLGARFLRQSERSAR